MAYVLNRTICVEGFLADSDGTPPSDVPTEFNVSAFDPDIGGQYGAYMYMYDCTPEPDSVFIMSAPITMTFTILQPPLVYAKKRPTFIILAPISLVLDCRAPTIIIINNPCHDC